MTFEELVNFADRRHPDQSLRETFECNDVSEMDPVARVILREIELACSDGDTDAEQMSWASQYLRDVGCAIITIAESFKNARYELRSAEHQKPDAAETP